MRPPTAPADGAENNVGRSYVRLTAAELTEEVAARDLEGLWERVLDVNVLEALEDAGRSEVQALEGNLRESRRELEAGLCTRGEEARELDARADGYEPSCPRANGATPTVLRRCRRCGTKWRRR